MRSYCVARLSFVLLGCACSFDLQGSEVESGGPSRAAGGTPSTLEWPSGSPETPKGPEPTAAVCPFDWATDAGGFGGAAGAPGALAAAGAAAVAGAGAAPGAAASSGGLVRGTGDLTVLLVFDKSGSMGALWETKSRWESASDAFLKGLEGVESEVTVGAITFPQDQACSVAPIEDERQIGFQAGTSFVERWQATGASSLPTGATPLGLAFARADEAIREAEACGLLEGRFRVVVVTDGEPNCGTDENALLSYAHAWRTKGIEVHVLGLPGSAAASHLLDRLAGVGGTDEHVPTETVDGAEEEFWNLVR